MHPTQKPAAVSTPITNPAAAPLNTDQRVVCHCAGVSAGQIRRCAADQPGILMDVEFDDKGDLDRDSFLTEVKNGKQEVTATLPPLGKKK